MVLFEVRRTAMAPLFAVDFADNMVGDVMTLDTSRAELIKRSKRDVADVAARSCWICKSKSCQSKPFFQKIVQVSHDQLHQGPALPNPWRTSQQQSATCCPIILKKRS